MHNPALDAWGDYDRDDPYPLFAQVQADDPVHAVTLADGHRAWLIVRHEEARAALNHAGLSKDMHAALARDGAVVAEGLPGPAFARHMLSVDPPDHTRLRRLASAAFSRPRIAALRPRVQAIVDGLLDDLEACGDTVVDLVKAFAFPLPFTVISEVLGVPEPDRDQLGAWFTMLLAPSSAAEPPAEAVAASANIVRYLTGLLARKRAAPGEDLVTDLVRAADQGALSEQEMLSTIFQLVVAGHDTTTSLIGNGTVALLLHPEQRDALVADPGLMLHAIEEILRWDAPVPHSTFRYSTQDVPLGGIVIPAFAQVLISLAAANRDPARYDDPDKFDIVRADTSHLAFGHGIHHCLGARLARLEGVMAFTTLLGRFPAMRLAVPRSALRWGHGDGLVLRGLTELPVIPQPGLCHLGSDRQSGTLVARRDRRSVERSAHFAGRTHCQDGSGPGNGGSMNLGSFLAALVLGFVAGAIARALIPNDAFRHMRGLRSWLTSAGLGLLGALVGFWIFHGLFGIGDTDKFDWGGIVGAIIGAMIVVALASFLIKRFAKREAV